jgi:hypothetical protein
MEHAQLNTLLYADDQTFLADAEDHVQRVVHKLWLIANQYNLSISTKNQGDGFYRSNRTSKKL